MAHELFNLWVRLEGRKEALVTKHQSDGTHAIGQNLCAECMAAINDSVAAHMALQALGDALLAQLPRVPAGYYIANCADPEGGCIGWHCFEHDGYEPPGEVEGGTYPTGYYYCDGGHPTTLAWLRGELTDKVLPE